jgi:iron complex outermembrane receptor protein
LTYDITPEYEITPDLNTYFRFARGSVLVVLIQVYPVAKQLADVNPEYLNSYELGLKSSLLGGDLVANANIFIMTIKISRPIY